jgi:5-methyltetrahydrofolate--homocysteine methyltransferase
MPIGADSTMVVRTLETIQMIREKYDLNTTLGASNVSFGMPDRHTLNSVFIPMAMQSGLTSAIMDSRTDQIVTAVRAADLMKGNDEWGANWIAAHRAKIATAS